MNAFNQCLFVGHAGSTPKLLTTGSGKSFTRFRLAVDSTQRAGEKSDPLWLTVLVWPEALAAVVAERVKTGSLVLVSGRISERQYTDGEGQIRTNLELTADKIEFLGTGSPVDAPKEQPEASQAPAV